MSESKVLAGVLATSSVVVAEITSHSRSVAPLFSKTALSAIVFEKFSPEIVIIVPPFWFPVEGEIEDISIMYLNSAVFMLYPIPSKTTLR